MPHWLKILMVALLFLLVAAIPLAMQSPTGALEGVLTDETGPVVGAKVEASHSWSGAMRQTVSDNRGFYRFSNLQRGTYSLWITDPRHESAQIPRVFVEDGATAHLDVRLVSMSRRSTETALPQ